MNWEQQLEIDAVKFAIGWFSNAGNVALLEKDIQPLVVVVENGILKVADAFFAKLPLGFGAMLDAIFQKYMTMLESNLTQYEGEGVTALLGVLNALLAKLQGNPALVKTA